MMHGTYNVKNPVESAACWFAYINVEHIMIIKFKKVHLVGFLIQCTTTRHDSSLRKTTSTKNMCTASVF